MIEDKSIVIIKRDNAVGMFMKCESNILNPTNKRKYSWDRIYGKYYVAHFYDYNGSKHRCCI
jgi:hypothetical protein